MKSPKIRVLAALCAFGVTTPLAAGSTLSGHGAPDLYSLHGVHFVEGSSAGPAPDLYKKPLTLNAFFKWTATSYPTGEKVIVLSDRTLQIGSAVYNN